MMKEDEAKNSRGVAAESPLNAPERGFTLGPWEVHGASNIYASVGRANIATVSDPYAGRFIGYQELRIDSPHLDEACANACLIAAAPQLFEALQNLYGDLYLLGLGEIEIEKIWQGSFKQARAALAKVKVPARLKGNHGTSK